MVADKGYHSNDVLTDLTALEMRSNRTAGGATGAASLGSNKRCMATGDAREAGQTAVTVTRRAGGTQFCSLIWTGRMRRTHLRGHENILKRLLIHGGAFNLSLVLRKERGAGTPRGLAEAKKAFDWLLETVRRTLLLRLWPHPANTPFRLQSQSCVFGPARTA